MASKKRTQLRLLTATGYAERSIDCPEWVQAAIAWEYLGIPDARKQAFDAGFIAVEWACNSYEDRWWRFCKKRDHGAVDGCKIF
jgi:hypothetical protein